MVNCIVLTAKLAENLVTKPHHGTLLTRMAFPLAALAAGALASNQRGALMSVGA
jgi:hypothetical protein